MMYRNIIFLFLPIIVLTHEDDLIVKISDGSILKGHKLETWKGREINAFNGIPYAKPPIGKLRFKNPVPASPWEGIYDATKPDYLCTQVDVIFDDYTVQGQEDCLYLNVYVPQRNSKVEPLPVLFFIHGGALMTGGAVIYKPDFLLEKDVILVTINYRLGALGFISTGDEIVPGNNGLKDQSLALQWTKANIANFGGDPNRITVYGESAGACSTHYHMLSPLSRDLINSAIVISGSALDLWSLSLKGETVKNTKKLGKLLKCPTENNSEMINCLQKIKVEDIVSQDKHFLEWTYDPLIIYKPVIEPDLEGAFLTEDPIDIMKSGKSAKVPLLTGLTTDEGAFKSAAIFNNSDLLIELNQDFNRIAPITLNYRANSPNPDVISNKIRQFYFGSKQIDQSMKKELTDLYTDTWFLQGQDATIQLHHKYSGKPVYHFLLEYRGSMSITDLFTSDTYDYGVCHADDLLYIFKCDLLIPNYKMSASDMEMSDKIITLWFNFIQTGNPTPKTDANIPNKWEAVSSDDIEYYSLKGPNDMTMEKKLFENRLLFLRDLHLDSRRNKIQDEL